MIRRRCRVRKRGLEPLRPKTLDPKSNAATNYATCAFADAKIAKNPACAKYNATCCAWCIGRVAVGLPHGGEAGGLFESVVDASREI